MPVVPIGAAAGSSLGRGHIPIVPLLSKILDSVKLSRSQRIPNSGMSFALNSRQRESKWIGGPAWRFPLVHGVKRFAPATRSFARLCRMLRPGPPQSLLSVVCRLQSDSRGRLPPSKLAFLVIGFAPFFADSVSFCSARGGSRFILLCYMTLALPLSTCLQIS